MDKASRKTRGSRDRASTKPSFWILGFVVVYVALQLLIPLRHLVYKRNLQWTHEGVNYGWRMMADHHESKWGMTIEDPGTKNVYSVSPEKTLNYKQLTMMGHSPYLLYQYVQFLKRVTTRQTGITSPIIKADVEVSVNGRPFQYMFDPAADLSAVTYSPFKEERWILPFKDK
jgi:vitamin K-dependent gamma-carboxylase